MPATTDSEITALRQRAEASGEGALTTAERNTLAASTLIAQVQNGGFAQYFFNPTGDQVYIAIEALDAQSATGLADLVRRACSFFPTGADISDHGIRVDHLAEVAELGEAPDSVTQQEWLEIFSAMLRGAEPVLGPVDREFYAELGRLDIDSLLSAILHG